MNPDNAVIFTPVFFQTKYRHHICSECGLELKLDQSIWGGPYFPYGKEKIRFCPGCGKPVIRFSDTPIYEEPVNFEPLRIFYEASKEYERKCQWLYHCAVSLEEQNEIDELLPFAAKDTGWIKKAHEAVKLGNKSIGRRTVEKLIKEFGEERDADDER